MSETTDDPEVRLTIERGTVENYRSYGNLTPPIEQLQQFIGVLEGSPHPDSQLTSASLYLDLAQHPDTPPKMVKALIGLKWIPLIDKLAATPLESIEERDTPIIYRAKLQRAYKQKILKTVLDVSPNLQDENMLYDDLLQIGGDILAQRPPMGELFVLTPHILIARLNNQRQDIKQSVWPSLTRQVRMWDYQGRKAGWDAAVTLGPFWDNSCCYHLNCKNAADENDYFSDEVVTLYGDRDLGLNPHESVVELAITERKYRHPPTQAAAKVRLDVIQQRFLERLGLSPDASATTD